MRGLQWAEPKYRWAVIYFATALYECQSLITSPTLPRKRSQIPVHQVDEFRHAMQHTWPGRLHGNYATAAPYTTHLSVTRYTVYSLLVTRRVFSVFGTLTTGLGHSPRMSLPRTFPLANTMSKQKKLANSVNLGLGLGVRLGLGLQVRTGVAPANLFV